jgi:hypothetical protein
MMKSLKLFLLCLVLGFEMLLLTCSSSHIHLASFFFADIDNEFGDIPVEEETHCPYHREPTYSHVDDFINNDEARNWTRFTKDEMRRLLDLFELPVFVTLTTDLMV